MHLYSGILGRCLLYTILAASCAAVVSCAHKPVSGTEPVYAEEDLGGVFHTVGKGQTLWRISMTYGVDLETVQWVNDIEDVTDIKVGRRIFIPGVDRILEVEGFRPEEGSEALRPGPMIDLIWPVDSTPSSGFGPRRGKKHEGIDLPAPRGTPVKASADGRVVYSGQGMRGYGKVVVLKHGSDLSTVYAHNNANLVRQGARVKQGEVIAKVGATGKATGPHLHFEIRRRGVAENPLKLLLGR